MKVLNPTSGFSAWGSNKGTGNLKGIWPWRPVGFDYRTSTGLGETETPVLESTNKILCIPRPREKQKWPHRRLNQNYLLVLEGLLWSCGSAGAHRRASSSSPGRSALAKALLKLSHRASRRQDWVASGQTTTRQGAQPHPWADNWIKALLSKTAHQSKTQFFLLPVPSVRKLTQAS